MKLINYSEAVLMVDIGDYQLKTEFNIENSLMDKVQMNVKFTI